MASQRKIIVPIALLVLFVSLVVLAIAHFAMGDSREPSALSDSNGSPIEAPKAVPGGAETGARSADKPELKSNNLEDVQPPPHGTAGTSPTGMPPFVESARAELSARRAAIAERRLGTTLDVTLPIPAFLAGTQPSAIWSGRAGSADGFTESPWVIGPKDETTDLFGSVFVIEGGSLRPLAGAVVTDVHGARAVTLGDGSFVLKSSSVGARVWLQAIAPGFVSAFEVDSLTEPSGLYSGKWFQIANCTSRPGAELFLVAAPNERITLRTSPPTPGIRLWAAWLGVGGSHAHFDQDFVFSAVADDRGETIFETSLRLVGAHFGAHGPGFVAADGDWTELPRQPDGQRIVEIRPRSAQTHLLRGAVHDLRSGASISGVRVATFSGAVVLTDSAGQFELWASSTQVGGSAGQPEMIQLSAWAYWGMETRLDGPETVAVSAGGCSRPENIGQPGRWEFQLRPTVTVALHVVTKAGAGTETASVNIPERNVWHGEAAKLQHTLDHSGRCNIARFPWGLATLEYAALGNGGWVRHDLAITAAMWAAGGPDHWEFTFEVP